MGAIKPKGLNMIAKIGQGHIQMYARGRRTVVLLIILQHVTLFFFYREISSWFITIGTRIPSTEVEQDRKCSYWLGEETTW